MEKVEVSNSLSLNYNIDSGVLSRALERERQGKRAAEKIIEEKSTELYYAYKELEVLNESLEKQVIKRTTQLKEALNRAEESAKVKETFLANMSHEIRTPMNSIIGFVNLLLKNEWPEKEYSFLNAIKYSSSNLLVLINDILDLSKISSGNLRLENIEFSFRELLHNTIYNFEESIKSKNLKIKWDVDSDIFDRLNGDPLRIQQILNNIIGNALKFTSEGSISVLAKLLSEEDDSQIIEINIIDTGIGIREDKLDSIFESFIQEDDSTTRQFGGTGLGLAICKQLVEQLNGKILIKSKKNVGTEFIIRLPFKKSKQEIKMINTEQISNKFFSAEVLVVEDNKFNQILIDSILTNHNYIIEIVDNGKLAIERLKKKKFDIVLMDIQMPIMGGIEATKIIRENLILDVPIIALTANALKGDETKYLNCGMNDYVSKPFEEAKLIDKINQLISMQRVEFNLNYLENISKGDTNFMIKILDQFVMDVLEALMKLNSCNDLKTMPKAKEILHSLKSSFKILEIKKLMEIVKRLEQWPENKESVLKFYDILSDFELKAREVVRKVNEERILHV